jgi:hypothetical protein
VARVTLAMLLVSAGAAALFLSLPSRAANPDGLRVFPGLHRVVPDSAGAPDFVPADWSAGYQPDRYFRANVQKHFLFPLHAFAGFHLARAFGWSGSGLKPVQALNVFSAALAVGLFALLVWLLFGSRPEESKHQRASIKEQRPRPAFEHCSLLSVLCSVLVPSLGLACSAAFSSMATNIAEVVPALPWLLLSLVLLAKQDEPDRRTVLIAGLLLGISAGFYLVSAAIGLALAGWLVVRRRPSSGLVLAGTMAVVMLTIYLGVLLAAGYRTLPQLTHALFFMPEQGTYGGFKLTNLATVWLGFAGSVFPALPEDFGGLRSLLAAGSSGYRFFLLVVVLPLMLLLSVTLLLALVRSRSAMASSARRLVGLGCSVFLGALAASLVWDPYHPKFWVFSNIGLWLMIAGYLAHLRAARRQGLISARVTPAEVLVALGLFSIVSMNLARRVIDAGPNPHEDAAHEVARRVNAEPGSLVLGGWEIEFDYLALLVPEENQLSLPDVILEQQRNPERFRSIVDHAFESTRARDGRVLVLNQFNRTPEELLAFYARRLKFPEFADWLEFLRPSARPVWQDSPGTSVLYELQTPQ